MEVVFLGQIVLLAFNFPPEGFASCDGKLLLIEQFPALFSLIGTVFGGDGNTTFALPNYQGLAPSGSGYYLALTGLFPQRQPV